MEPRQRRSNSCSETFDLSTFGEALFRYLPVERTPSEEGAESQGECFLRTVGGAEVNVCVALARLGMKTSWVSVLPEGLLGDEAHETIRKTGVDMRWCQRTQQSDMGIYQVVPEERSVHYQRRNSAFNLMRAGTFDWFSIASSSRWIHLTGITPMLADTPRAGWIALLEEAKLLSIPVSLDLNFRPALSTLDELMYVVLPYMPSLQLLVLSRATAVQLARKLLPEFGDTPDADLLTSVAVARLREKLKCTALAVTFTERQSDGQQSRWSILANKEIEVSTFEQKSQSQLVEFIGGGDAWMAGFLNVIIPMVGGGNLANLTDAKVILKALHRGDVLAALAQTKLGDFSSVTMETLVAAEEGHIQS